jgi:hypothetical protein
MAFDDVHVVFDDVRVVFDDVHVVFDNYQILNPHTPFPRPLSHVFECSAMPGNGGDMLGRLWPW